MGTNLDYARIGRNIRSRRHRLGLTLEDLAERSGRHPTYIGQIERGSKKATLETLSALAQVLGVGLRDFFDPVSSPSKAPVRSRIDALLSAQSPAKKKVLFMTLRNLARELKRLRD